MKTPDKIKKGIECCIKYLACVPTSECCDDCPYVGSCSSLEKDALAYIKQLEAKVPKWISVEEMLPNQYEDVLTFSNDNELLICHYDGHGWIVVFDGCYNDGDVTHWMYLPQDPRTEV